MLSGLRETSRWSEGMNLTIMASVWPFKVVKRQESTNSKFRRRQVFGYCRDTIISGEARHSGTFPFHSPLVRTKRLARISSTLMTILKAPNVPPYLLPCMIKTQKVAFHWQDKNYEVQVELIQTVGGSRFKSSS